MRYIVTGFFFVLFFVIPITTHGAIRITEVAWMGVVGESGQFGEWVELFNNDTVDVNLAGWKLYGDGGSQLIFTLTKTIPAGGYLLIERTTASMIDPVPGVDDEHGSFGGGGLSNEGEDIVLKDSSGAIIQSLSFSSGWPAGDAATKQTMQWNGSTWVTATPTPKAPTPGDDEEDEEPSVDEDEERAGSEKPTKKYTLKLTLDIPSQLYQHVDYTFDPVMILEDGLSHIRGPIRWNMGDGTAIAQKNLEAITHRYRYPGTYTLWIGCFKTVFDKKPYLEFSKIIKVGSPIVTLSVLDGEAVEITNQSADVVDLSNWLIIADGKQFELPVHTTIAADASVVISAITLGFDSLRNVSLARPGGEILYVDAPSSVLGATTADSHNPSSVETVFAEEIVQEEGVAQKMQNRTKKIIFGAVSLTVLALCLLLERFMAKRE